jgi:hemerythrin-like domain-containing protein
MMDGKPTKNLEQECRVIERVVALIAVTVECLEAGYDLEREVLSGMIELMHSLADRIDDGKEDAILFPLLAGTGHSAEGGPIGALTYEHQMGRALVAEFAQALAAYAQNGSVRAALAKKLRELTTGYRDRTGKTDYLLFPMSDEVLCPREEKSHQDLEPAAISPGACAHRRLKQ